MYRLAQAMNFHQYPSGWVFPKEVLPGISLIKNGKLERYIDDEVFETLTAGHFFGEESVMFKRASLFQVRVTEPTEIYQIPSAMLLDIPVVRWKLFEIYQRRMEIDIKSGEDSIPLRP